MHVLLCFSSPFISPLLFTITPALSSKYMKTPSFLRNGFLCLITTAGITEKCSKKDKSLIKHRLLKGLHATAKRVFISCGKHILTGWFANQIYHETMAQWGWMSRSFTWWTPLISCSSSIIKLRMNKYII